MSDRSKYALATEYCRAGFDQVAAWLPPGFISPAVYYEWSSSFRAGKVRHLAARALLPLPETWPTLEPICSTNHDDPRDIFLHTVQHKANFHGRVDRMRAAAHALPFFSISIVRDDRTSDLHRGRANRVAYCSDPLLDELLFERVWTCRCTVLQGSAGWITRRGLTLPEQAPC